MKAKELMIGDICRFSKGKYPYKRGDVYVINRPECIHLYDKLEGIPLTTEILEKNGFERRGGVSCHKSITSLIIHHWNDDLCFLNYSKKNIPPIMIPFHYVHELQRALRCCGLWELAENFKVD